jgi:hypothetical protein
MSDREDQQTNQTAPMENCNKHIRGQISTGQPDMSDREDQQTN